MKISTHAPLAGRDTRHIQRLARAFYFNPRAPCGARPLRTYKYRGRQGFQPTRPLRGATRFACLPFGTAKFQPTRPLRGATESPTCKPEGSLISTHAPLAGRDAVAEINAVTEVTFQPTRPLRGATFAFFALKVKSPSYFNPRAPCGARLEEAPFRYLHRNFNPRAPCGARQQKCTNHYAHFCDNRQISDAFAQNAACQGILLLFDAGKPCGFWVRTAQVISAHLCFAL